MSRPTHSAHEPGSRPGRRRRLVRVALILAAYAGLVAAGQVIGVAALEVLERGASAETVAWMRGAVIMAAALYAMLMMLPFLPGIEVGLALMAMFGADVCLLVYGATVAGLSAAFLVGRLVPVRVCAAFFGFLGLRRARRLVLDLAPLDERARLDLLLRHAPRRFVPFLLRHRYLALALALNLPGNALLGGGGGIAMTAGMSGLFAPQYFMPVVMIAVAPVPLAVLLTGYAPMPW